MGSLFGLKKLFGKSAKTDTIIIVSGLPRSGTSMMMKILESAGLEILTDDLRKADESNPKGYYEYERVKKLKEGDFDWLQEARGKVVKIISALLEYLPNQYTYKIIFMRRSMEEILSSQRQMLLRDGRQADQAEDEKLAKLYQDHLDKVEAWVAQQPNMDCISINYNETIRNPEQSIAQVNQFLGGNLDVKRMSQAIDQKLYRERQPG
jgi:GTP1/Obg family GTP-binding protein